MKKNLKEVLACVVKMILLICAALSLYISITSFLKIINETEPLQKQEEIGQLIAEEYLTSISQGNRPNTEIGNVEPVTDLDYEDNKLYKWFTESNAQGRLDAILEIPAISLRQSIFSGTAQQIEHDLANWLMVTARADFELGKTRYCIYAHNPLDKSLQISKAQTELKVGDYLIMTTDEHVYFYTISDIFGEYREKCTEEIVNNEDIGPECLYIFTCGRNEWQNKNLVIEAKIYQQYSLEDWIKNQDNYITEYKSHMQETEKPALLETTMQVKKDENMLMVDITDNNGNNIASGFSIGVFDENGYLVGSKLYEYKGTTVSVPIPEQEGLFYIGAYEAPDGYEKPEDKTITITEEQQIITIENMTQTSLPEETKTFQRDMTIVCICISAVLSTMAIIMIVTSVFRKRAR